MPSTPTTACDVVTSSPDDLATAHLRHSHDLPARHREMMTQDAIGAINDFHRRATGAAEAARKKADEATHFALLAGSRLQELHDSLPHGEWGTLFSNNAQRLTSNSNHNAERLEFNVRFEFGQETARKYMEVSKRIRAEQNLSAKAQKRLAIIAAEPEVTDESRAWLEKLTSGRTLRQLYFDLGVLTPGAEKETKPAPAPPAGPRKSKEQLLLEDAREAFFLWREMFEKLLRQGVLDDIDKPGLEELKEFVAGARDRINARLKNF